MRLGPRAFLNELHRRKVFSSTFTYVVVAWLLLQVADVLLPIYDAPDWVLKMFTTVLFLGFPMMLILSWFFNFTLSGIVPTLQDETAVRAAESPGLGQRYSLELPEGPSIAVLPFRNLSGDPDQDLFAEALSGDIVSGLTQSSHLFVLTAAAAATYTDDEQDSATIGSGLGVKYLLRGSVRKSGTTLRVSAQLIDAANGIQLWSQNYDRELNAAALFAVQDDVRGRIVATLSDLHGVIYSSQAKSSSRRPTDKLNAYECLAVALAYDRYLSAETHLQARESLEHAVEIDPEYDAAWAHLSWVYTDEWVWGFNPLPNSMQRAMAAAQRGIRLAPDNYHNHWLMSRVHYFVGDLDLFHTEAQRALRLNANDGTTLGLIGMYTAWSGDWHQGLAMMEKAKQLNPSYPDYYHVVAGTAEFAGGNYSAALHELLKANLLEWPILQIFLTATYARLAQPEQAEKHIAVLRKLLAPDSNEAVKTYLSLSFPFLPEFVADTMQGIDFCSQQSPSQGNDKLNLPA